jgi:hypothetical protein
MAAGVTDHVWTLQELLMYRVPPRAPENIVSIDEGHQRNSTGAGWRRSARRRCCSDAVSDAPLPAGAEGQAYWVHLDGRGSVAGISPSTRARAPTTTGMMLTARSCRPRATGRTRTTITPSWAKNGMSTWACMNLAFGSMTRGQGCGGRGSRWRGMPGSPARGTATSMPMPARSVTMTRMVSFPS